MADRYKVIFFDLGDTLVNSDNNWMPGASELIVQLHQNNVRLGIISNTGQLNREQLFVLLPVDFNWAYFEEDLIILSSEVSIEKPALDIFKLAIARSNLESSQCLFCTENALDCLVAQQVGLHSYRIQKPPNNDIAAVIQTLKELNKICS